MEIALLSGCSLIYEPPPVFMDQKKKQNGLNGSKKKAERSEPAVATHRLSSMAFSLKSFETNVIFETCDSRFTILSADYT